MYVGLFLLGLLVGVGLAWFFLERARRDETAERETGYNARLTALQNELRDADAALAETKQRLIELQMEQRASEARVQSLEAELAQAKRAAEQAIEQEMRQREVNAQLQDEIVALKRGRAGKPAKATDGAGKGEGKPASGGLAEKIEAKSADDLTVIRGIGKVIEKKLHELGISSFRQLAALTPSEVEKVNEAIEFPGRVERENWIEQAKQRAR